RKFADHIGFSDVAKAEAMMGCVAKSLNPNRDLLPSAPILRRLIHATNLAPKRILPEIGTAPLYLDTKRLGGATYQDNVRPILSSLCEREGETLNGNQFRAARILTAEDVNHIRQGMCDLDYLDMAQLVYEEVKSVEEVEYEGWVYDFTVADTHNFVA